jgi:hypothetical protein
LRRAKPVWAPWLKGSSKRAQERGGDLAGARVSAASVITSQKLFSRAQNPVWFFA